MASARRRGSRRFVDRLVLLVALLTGLLLITGLPDTSGPARTATGTVTSGQGGAPQRIELEMAGPGPGFLPSG